MHPRVAAARGRARRAGAGASTPRAARSAGVVGAHGARPDEHRVARRRAAGARPRAPRRDVIHLDVAVGRGRPPVERRRPLEHDVRTARRAVVQVRRRARAATSSAPHPTTTSMPASRRRADAPTRDALVGVYHADDDTRDARRARCARCTAGYARCARTARASRRACAARARPRRRRARRPRRGDRPAPRSRRSRRRRHRSTTTAPTHGLGRRRFARARPTRARRGP